MPPSPKATSRLRSSGFTVLEIMIVVAIVGTLASMGGPKYLEFKARAKRSEGKVMISNLATSLIAYKSEVGYFTDCLNEVGWCPEGTPHYAVGFGDLGSGRECTTNNNSPELAASGACSFDTSKMVNNAGVPYTGANLGAGRVYTKDLGPGATQFFSAWPPEEANLSFKIGAVGNVDRDDQDDRMVYHYSVFGGSLDASDKIQVTQDDADGSVTSSCSAITSVFWGGLLLVLRRRRS